MKIIEESVRDSSQISSCEFAMNAVESHIDRISTEADESKKRSPSIEASGRLARPQVSVVGLGYVGLAPAVCFAAHGYRVRGVDIDELKCNLIQGGRSPIHEEGIDCSLKEGIESGRFSCSTDVQEAVLNSDITFLTVGTPSKPNGDIDLKYIESAA